MHRQNYYQSSLVQMIKDLMVNFDCVMDDSINWWRAIGTHTSVTIVDVRRELAVSRAEMNLGPFVLRVGEVDRVQNDSAPARPVFHSVHFSYGLGRPSSLGAR